VLLLFSLAGEK